jgi:hypothetical protein
MGRSALAAFGRSGADRMIMNFLQENRMQKESGSRIAIQEAQLEKYNREKAIADKEAARRGTSMDVRKWADEKLPGGSEGAYGRAMIGEAKRRGELDISSGDMGSISQGAGEDIFAELDKNPTWAAKIHGEHLDDLHKKRQSIMTAIAEKPNDKNMQEQLEQTNRQIQQATEIMPGIKAEIKRQDEIKKAEVLAKSKADLEMQKEKARIKAQEIKDKEAAKAAKLKADALVKSQKLQRENVLEAARIRSKSGKNADGSPYTVQQKVDDARQFYSLKKASLFEMGMLREGKEDEYDKLMENLAKDLNLVMDGKTPSYLDIKEKPRTVVRTGKHKGKKVVEYSDGSIEYAD